MNRRRFLRAALGLGVLASTAGIAAPDRPLAWRRRALVGFGTALSLTAGHEDDGRADEALDAAVALLRRIESQMSLFDPDSAVSRLNRDGVLRRIPRDLREVLRVAHWVSRASDGAFDATVQPLWRAFDEAARNARLPGRRRVADALAHVGWRALTVSDDEARFERAGMSVTLNGIAQGFAADAVRQVLSTHGIRHALIDAGEFATLGSNQAGRPWALGIADPRDDAGIVARLLSDGRCVATSADNATAFSADRRHHHIFDPHTGYSPPALCSVTVVATRGAMADALTKVMFVAGPQRIPALAARFGVDAMWVEKGGRRGWTPGLEGLSLA